MGKKIANIPPDLYAEIMSFTRHRPDDVRIDQVYEKITQFIYLITTLRERYYSNGGPLMHNVQHHIGELCLRMIDLGISVRNRGYLIPLYADEYDAIGAITNGRFMRRFYYYKIVLNVPLNNINGPDYNGLH